MWSAGSSAGPARHGRRGFTLLELLVVLAIAGGLLAIVPPLFSRALPGLQLKESTHYVVSALRRTRDLAIREQRSQRLELDLRERRVAVPGGSRAHTLPGGIELDLTTVASELNADGSLGGIRYFPDGSSSGGRITLSRGSQAFLIDIDWLTGRVSIL